MPASPTIARRIAAELEAGSFIRDMFEKGLRLKAQYGADQVFDLSLGNPNAPPPPAFFESVMAVAQERNAARHRYMPNAGFEETRAAVAAFAAEEYRLEVPPDGVIMTSGAAGGLNVVLHAICNPGDEVIVLAPYFVEYRAYIEQAGARMVLVQTDAEFQPDIAAIGAAINERTRAVLINSPNNPSGAVYTEAKYRALAELLQQHDRPDRPLYIVCDDPYRRIIYDIDWSPTPAHHYPRTLLVSSYSKDLSIAGERAGYIVVSAGVPERAALLGAMIMLNRTLGYVNAAAFMQRVVARCPRALCDVNFYKSNRDLLCNALREFGYPLAMPQGALYAFPQTPIPDDAAFVAQLVEHRVLAVPGRGFGRPGYMRLCFCVDRKTIEGALPGLRAAISQARR